MLNRAGSAESVSAATDTGRHLAAVFGDTAGRAHMSIGSGPYLDDRGAYKYADFSSHHFAWPDEAALLEREILRAAHDGDVYLCPYLMHGDKRTPGGTVVRRILHADVDNGALDLGAVRQLGGWVVASGSPGNGHVYLHLTESIPAHWHKALELGLVAYLGADNKNSTNDLLRPPGTLNHKAPTHGQGDARPVRFLIAPEDAKPVDPSELAATLGVILPDDAQVPAPAAAADTRYVVERVAVDAPELAALVAAIVDESLKVRKPGSEVVDRSEDLCRVVNLCARQGLSLPETRWLVRDRRPDLAGKIDSIRRDEVAQLYSSRAARIDALQRADAAFFSQYPTVSPPVVPAAATDSPDGYEGEVLRRLHSLRVDAEARKRFDVESQPRIELPPVRGLAALLAEPDCETPYRIESLAPVEARVLLSAQFKAGKSTLSGNLIGSLVDGRPFLDHFAVNQRAEHLVLVDDELSPHTLRRWLRDQRIGNVDGVADVVTLRGKVSTFNLLDDRVRGRWARRFRDLGADYLVFDCLRPVLDALGLDENRDAGKFLTAFDALLDEAGIGDALVVQHMGHSGERARGDSRLQDWPDAIWRLVRESDDPASPRYFSAYGRDVDVAETQLGYDPESRRLSVVGGTRQDARQADADTRRAVRADASVHEALSAVVAVLVDAGLKRGPAEGLGKNQLKTEVGARFNIGNRRVDEALSRGTADGLLAYRTGARNALIYTLANPCSKCGQPVRESGRDRHRECER